MKLIWAKGPEKAAGAEQSVAKIGEKISKIISFTGQPIDNKVVQRAVDILNNTPNSRTGLMASHITEADAGLLFKRRHFTDFLKRQIDFQHTAPHPKFHIDEKVRIVVPKKNFSKGAEDGKIFSPSIQD